jgi:hypothetical protein
VFKGKISQNNDQIEKCASKDDLAAAIKRSDELLALMKARTEEDRSKGQGQYREFSSLLHGQDKRITMLETQQNAYVNIINEMKKDFKSEFKDLHTELKELQNEIKESRKVI